MVVNSQQKAQATARKKIASAGHCSYQIMNRYEIFHPLLHAEFAVNCIGLPDYDVYSLQ